MVNRYQPLSDRQMKVLKPMPSAKDLTLAPARARLLLELAAAGLGIEPRALDRAIWLHESPSEPGPSRIGASVAPAP